MGKKQPLYASDEERRAAIAAKMRAHWRNPAMRAAWKKSMHAAARKSRDDYLSDETLSQLLREYVERDPSDQKIWRYTTEQLGRRYLISPSHVAHLAMRYGLKRRARMKKLGPAKVKEIIRRYVVLGHSVRALALSMNVSDCAIRYRLKKSSIDASMRGSQPERLAA